MKDILTLGIESSCDETSACYSKKWKRSFIKCYKFANKNT